MGSTVCELQIPSRGSGSHVEDTAASEEAALLRSKKSWGGGKGCGWEGKQQGAMAWRVGKCRVCG